MTILDTPKPTAPATKPHYTYIVDSEERTEEQVDDWSSFELPQGTPVLIKTRDPLGVEANLWRVSEVVYTPSGKRLKLKGEPGQWLLPRWHRRDPLAQCWFDNAIAGSGAPRGLAFPWETEVLGENPVVIDAGALAALQDIANERARAARQAELDKGFYARLLERLAADLTEDGEWAGFEDRYMQTAHGLAYDYRPPEAENDLDLASLTAVTLTFAELRQLGKILDSYRSAIQEHEERTERAIEYLSGNRAFGRKPLSSLLQSITTTALA